MRCYKLVPSSYSGALLNFHCTTYAPLRAFRVTGGCVRLAFCLLARFFILCLSYVRQVDLAPSEAFALMLNRLRF